MNDRFSADDLPRKPASAPVRGPWPVDLAHTRPFRIGNAEVRPATLEVIGGERREVLEPRVMEVLVVLAAANGAILSRDDLITACWEGRAVTDDAINRVISRLRALGRTFGTFKIETITKVGYRLVEHGAIASQGFDHPNRHSFNRRALVGGGLAAAGLGTAFLLSSKPWKHRPPAEAVELFRRGDLAQRVGTPDQSRQSASYFERAVRIDPEYSAAWGALALAYTHNLDGHAEAELASMPGRIGSAARRALQLDPSNADAQLALICTPPSFRNWVRMEAQLRDFCDRFPRHWLGHGRLALLLYQVGRLNDGIAFHKKTIAIDPMIAGPYAFAAAALSNAGRIQEADMLLRRAHEQWPAHPLLWMARYDHLLFSGRPKAAAAFIMDPDALPSGIGPAFIDARLRLARASESRGAADIEHSLDDFRRIAVGDTFSIPVAAPVFALLDRADLAFESLERYLLNKGSFGKSSPIGNYTRRYTSTLFSRPFAPLRADSRFGALIREVGLEAYWRQTGTTPDYRRSA